MSSRRSIGGASTAPGLRLVFHAGVEHGSRVAIEIGGVQVPAFRGETVAATLMAAGHRCFRMTPGRGEPRGLFCGMGVCYDCLVVIDGVANVRACMTTVTEGMVVQMQIGYGADDAREASR